MIQTTKDADKAKTSQRQRVDDQNDKFVSRNCHHALPSVARVLGAIVPFLQRFPGFAAPQKGALGSAEGVRQTALFLYLTLLTIQALFL
jgi:hypothetical protein